MRRTPNTGANVLLFAPNDLDYEGGLAAKKTPLKMPRLAGALR